MALSAGSLYTNGKPQAVIPAPPALPDPMPDSLDLGGTVKILQRLIERVTEEDCCAQNVNAACNAAARIADFLRIHLDAERLRRQSQR